MWLVEHTLISFSLGLLWVLSAYYLTSITSAHTSSGARCSRRSILLWFCWLWLGSGLLGLLHLRLDGMF